MKEMGMMGTRRRKPQRSLVQCNLKVPRRVHDRLKLFAVRRDESMQTIMARALMHYLEAENA